MSDKYNQEQYFGKPQVPTQKQIEEVAKLVAKIAVNNSRVGYLNEGDKIGAGFIGKQAEDTGIRNS